MENKKIVAGIFLLILVVFFFRGFIYLDPDFGYRLRTGAIILSQGFPRSDPYSYTMSSFPYVEHAWLVAVSWALAFPFIGKIGLTALSVLAALGALVISASRAVRGGDYKKEIGLLGLIPFVLSVAVILSFFGIRAQVMSWLMMAVLLAVVLNSSFWQKGRYATPIFFLFWANLHGSFIAGLSVLVFVVSVRAIRTKNINAKDILVVALSIAATFINPYGIGAYREALSSAGDLSLRLNIAEWMPAIFLFDFAFISFVSLSILLVYRYRKKFLTEEIGLYLIFFLQALLSIRNIPLWILLAMPMTISSLTFFYEEVKDMSQALPRLKKIYLYAWIGSLVILVSQTIFSLKNANALSINSFYPQGAIVYLGGNLPRGEIFSEYGWGGYLIWKLPEKKVFIDGRMPSWRWDSYPENESGRAFDEYSEILKGERDYKDSFEKYNVDTILWPREESTSTIGKITKKLEGLFSQDSEKFNLLEQIEKDGWEKVYEDEISVIYQEPN